MLASGIADSSTKGIILTIASLAVALISYISEEYRWPIIVLFLSLTLLVYVTELDRKSKENSELIKKLNEKIKIYRELSILRAKIEEF